CDVRPGVRAHRSRRRIEGLSYVVVERQDAVQKPFAAAAVGAETRLERVDPVAHFRRQMVFTGLVGKEPPGPSRREQTSGAPEKEIPSGPDANLRERNLDRRLVGLGQPFSECHPAALTGALTLVHAALGPGRTSLLPSTGGCPSRPRPPGRRAGLRRWRMLPSSRN